MLNKKDEFNGCIIPTLRRNLVKVKRTNPDKSNFPAVKSTHEKKKEKPIDVTLNELTTSEDDVTYETNKNQVDVTHKDQGQTEKELTNSAGTTSEDKVLTNSDI